MSKCQNEEKNGGRSGERTSPQEESHDSTSIEELQVSGLLSEHAELMCTHAEQLQSMLCDTDQSSWPWGSHDHTSYEMMQYGKELMEQRDRNDPIHEITTLRRSIKKLTKELRKTRKRVMESRDCLLKEIIHDGCEVELKRPVRKRKVGLIHSKNSIVHH